MPRNLSRTSEIRCEPEEVKGHFVEKLEGSSVIVRCHVKHVAFETGRHVVSIRGESHQDREVIAQNKMLVSRKVLESTQLHPDKTELMLGEEAKEERIACRLNQRTLKLELKLTGEKADFNKSVNKELQNERNMKYRSGPER